MVSSALLVPLLTGCAALLTVTNLPLLKAFRASIPISRFSRVLQPRIEQKGPLFRRILALSSQSSTESVVTAISHQSSRPALSLATEVLNHQNATGVWEQLAIPIANVITSVVKSTSIESDFSILHEQIFRLNIYTQTISALRVGVPALLAGCLARAVYPSIALALVDLIHDDKVFEVVSQDLSQFLQNIVTTSGLLFGLLSGQTYYL
jgi:hypothetical protein